MSEEEAFKLLGQALAALPGVVGLIVEGLALGHGDPVTRRKVADILPVDSASRAAQRSLEAAPVAASVPAELAPAVVVVPSPLPAPPSDTEPPAGGAAE